MAVYVWFDFSWVVFGQVDFFDLVMRSAFYSEGR